MAISWTSLSTVQEINSPGPWNPSKCSNCPHLIPPIQGKQRTIALVGEDDIKIEMRIPQEAVKLITGRQGANIKQLRKQTGALNDVDTEDVGDERVLLISGFPVQFHGVFNICYGLEEPLPGIEVLSRPRYKIPRYKKQMNKYAARKHIAYGCFPMLICGGVDIFFL
ncbi:tudor and KH domain-containing protein [Cricetulus griseus]|uniref:Tudor and KH domain-containing protein n=1 Tax=Cricetulus griseus TaxID=10029 RepID=A0A061ILU6_CRIGR|nr:tudor and KH domain-containing protein [Cricetulus griseus]